MGKKVISCLLCIGMLFCVPAVFSQTAFYSAVYAAEYDADTIASVQNALNDAGYECGAADGVAGSKTQEAIRQYQEANGLTASGEIDDELLVSLGLMSESDEEVNESADEPAVGSSEDSEDESLPHIENENGVYDVLGYDFYTVNPEMTILYVFSRYENTTASTMNFDSLVLVDFHMSAYQDDEKLAIALEPLFYLDLKDPEWETAVSSDSYSAPEPEVTEIQPGESVILYTEFSFRGDSDIEVEVGASAGDDVLDSFTVKYDAPESSIADGDLDTESEDSLMHLESSYGTYDLLGFEFDDSDPETITLYVISEYKNTTNEVYSPYRYFTIQPFQDGLGVDQAGYTVGSSRDTEWGEASDPDTEVQPGESVVYFTPFKLSTNSEIEVEVTTYSIYGDEQPQSYTVECDESVASKLSSPEEIEFDAESESLLHMDGEGGTYDLLGYMFDSSDNGTVVYVFSRYENTGDSSSSLSYDFSVSAYQDGVSMDGGYYYSNADFTGTEWEKARGSSTRVKPGASLICYTSFQLSSDSEIELDVTSYDMYSFVAEEESYMIECDESVASGLGSSVDDDAVMDSLLHIENENGAYDLVGCYYTTSDFKGEETGIFYVFTRFENTSGDTVSPQFYNRISAYQDGEELNSSGIYISLNDTEWAKARSAGTYVKPGASMIYYVAFAPSGDSDIEVRFSDSWGEDLGSYTFKYGEW